MLVVAYGGMPESIPLFPCAIMKRYIKYCMICLCMFLWVNPAAGYLEIMAEGREPLKVVVPNLKGIPSDLALQIVQLVGLNGKIQHAGPHTVMVIAQQPAPGALVASGSQIVLSLGETVRPEPRSTTQVTLQRAGQGGAGLAAPVVPATQQNQMSIMYAPKKSVEVGTPLAWFPRQFLRNEHSRSMVPFLQRELPKTKENPYGVKPFRMTSSGSLPIVLVPTQGWQYGWIPSLDRVAPPQSPGVSASPGVAPVILSSGASAIQVPSYIRLSLSDAKLSIRNRGLAVGTVVSVAHSQMRSGLVVQQSPSAGVLVPQGTAISLWVVK
ncbi:hypothetical protein CSB45_05575 [candidate division KSB3 bacterium]|uniref:PASTA domain-containing protein n=1 Tax=candidate division KSB3 bacterium TaxID=2044937 RepID=A0A2G6E6J0_9BACT|nr:MAG: hypothetical protein CSB45_05575 [candidate division KSB3 bacterium]PIE30125.1 MAG: hypothetical protein CSA57_04285 [candidate division KSB3 bacterium]